MTLSILCRQNLTGLGVCSRVMKCTVASKNTRSGDLSLDSALMEPFGTHLGILQEGESYRPSSYHLLGHEYLLLGTIYPQLMVPGGSWMLRNFHVVPVQTRNLRSYVTPNHHEISLESAYPRAGSGMQEYPRMGRFRDAGVCYSFHVV